MKRLIFLLMTCLAAPNVWAQDITGTWNGILKTQNVQLRLVFHIQKTESGYSATLDSPDQGGKDILVTSVSYENSVLKIAISNIYLRMKVFWATTEISPVHLSRLVRLCR